MPIYSISRGKLELIPETAFGLEKDVQMLVEGNMKTIFGISSVTSEFELNDLRVDSLGYGAKANSCLI